MIFREKNQDHNGFACNHTADSNIEFPVITRKGYTDCPVDLTFSCVHNFPVLHCEALQVTYEGDVAIAGVPGTSARIELHFQNVVGSKTGGLLLPTGRLRDVIAGVEVTCIDCGMPIIIARASAMGKTGYETPSELNSDGDFFQNLETIRRIAGTMMGLGDVTDRVIPKFAIVAAPRKSHGTVTARYFVPTATHATMAVTGAISIACCCVLEGTVAYDVATHADIAHNVVIEHPVGEMRIVLKVKKGDNEDHLAMDVQSAGVVRTARLLFSGLVRVPGQELAQVDELEQNQEMNQQFRKLFQGVGKETLPTKSSRTLKASALKLRTRGMPAIRIQARVSGNTHHFNVGPLGRYPSGLSSPGFCYK